MIELLLWEFELVSLSQKKVIHSVRWIVTSTANCNQKTSLSLSLSATMMVPARLQVKHRLFDSAGRPLTKNYSTVSFLALAVWMGDEIKELPKRQKSSEARGAAAENNWKIPFFFSKIQM